MTITRQTPESASPTQLQFLSRVPIWVVAVGALLVAALATEAYGLVARAVGVDFLVGSFGSAPAEIPVTGLFTTVLIDGSPGIVLALALARWAKHPRATWRRTAWTLTALSMVPIAFVEASVTTQIALALAHLVAAAIVIPTLATRLADRNPRD